MNRFRNVILMLLIGIVPLAAALVTAHFFLAEDEPAQAPPSRVVEEPPPEVPTRTVVAATRPLPIGTLLDARDLSELELERTAVQPEHIRADEPPGMEGLRGHVVREAIAGGAPLKRSALIAPRQRGFLAAVLRAGTRAVAVQLGAEVRQAALIDPGDRVDVILTTVLRSDDGTQNAIARTILEDVRVVAIDQSTSAEVDAEGDDASIYGDDITTATLEVLPAQAARLALGKDNGKLSLAVRSLTSPTAAQDSVATLDLRELLTPTEEPLTRLVFAAARGLPAGTLLSGEDLGEIELERSVVSPGHILADEPSAGVALRGYVMRESLAAGEPFTRTAVIGPRQAGFLAAVLRPGRRAVTVRLEAAEAWHAGLIGPGDRVDVILTAGLKSDGGEEDVLTRVILENIRVVAIDRPPIAAGAGADLSGKTITATLEVLPAQVSRLTLGNREGKLSVAVRPPVAGPAAHATLGVRELLFAAPAAEKARDRSATAAEAPLARRTVRVIRGDKLLEEGFSYRQ